MLASDPGIPRTVGPYVLRGWLAQGGMGTIHLGEERVPGRPPRLVAIKRLKPQFARDPDFVAMFRGEMRLASRVRHPNVVLVEDTLSDAGELFMVMEYIPGASLSAALAAGPAPPAIASRVLCDVLQGLHAAHEARDASGGPLGIVHRDVSPSNVLLGEDGVARLADFGIARATVQFHATTPGQIKGKLKYMSPEQLRGATATRQCDVYAAAVVLWEALTGRRLVRGDSYAEIFGQVLEGIVPLPSSLSPVSAEVDRVVMRGLAREPEARFQAALDMALALEAALPPAPSAEVGAWLRRAAEGDLARRAQHVTGLLGAESDAEEGSFEGESVEEETPTLRRA